MLLFKASQEGRKKACETGEESGKEKEKVTRVCELLQARYGAYVSPSRRESPFQVLVATVLSVRSRDANTAAACEQLFSKYPTAESLARAPLSDVEKRVKPAGMYKTKAKNLIAIARYVSEHGVPRTIEGLISLPGVGRKVANCTLIYAFGISAMCVDTHVHRISNLLGWVHTNTPDKTEIALRALLPRRYWCGVNSWLVNHGQTICPANRPRCGECFLNGVCEHGRQHNG